MPNNGPDLGPLLAGGALALLLYLLVTAGVVVLGIWLTYTIIWRAVRRGLREYHATSKVRPLAKTGEPPRDWFPR